MLDLNVTLFILGNVVVPFLQFKIIQVSITSLVLFVLLVLVLSSYSITKTALKVADANQDVDTLKLVAALEQVAHHHAVERGLTAGYLGAPTPNKLSAINQQRQKADAAVTTVNQMLSQEWHQRLEDMLAVKDTVVDVLDQGKTCEAAWDEAYGLAVELGYQENLMGMKPDQSRFLGHSVGLQLDESPVVAAGFDRALPIGGAMAIEPKVVYAEGCIGSEDTWIRDQEGMRPVTAGGAWPWLTEW